MATWVFTCFHSSNPNLLTTYTTGPIWISGITFPNTHEYLIPIDTRTMPMETLNTAVHPLYQYVAYVPREEYENGVGLFNGEIMVEGDIEGYGSLYVTRQLMEKIDYSDVFYDYGFGNGHQ
jgi:hypothetical protein